MTSLAVSIAAPDTDAAKTALQQAAQVADMAELRLDLMHEFDLQRLLQTRPLPVIVTCRPRREGGRWRGSESERLAVLQAAAGLGVDYVDLEWDAAGQLDSLRKHSTRVILSRHDFDAMPDDLYDPAQQLRAAGADVVKLVGVAHHLADILPAIDLLDRSTGPVIAIAMGASGLATRLLAFRYPQSFLSFAALDGSFHPTAPGQIDVSTMEAIFRTRSINAETAIVGWLADNANDAPEVVAGNAWLAKRRLNVRVVPLQAAAGEETRKTLERLQELLPLAGCLAPVGSGLLWWTASARDWSHCQFGLMDALAALVETTHGP